MPGTRLCSQAQSVTSSVIRQLTQLTGAQVLASSIAYHDPAGSWGASGISFRLFESRPGISPDDGGNYRITDILIDPASSLFRLEQQRGADRIVREVTGDNCLHVLNGSSTFSTTARDAFGLDCARSTRMRDYYTYLWGLPMKLSDPGTVVGAPVHLADFFGDTLLQVRVTYDPDVGSDVWYFYFDPETFALCGYRFYHDESANDGEYILISGEVNVGTFVLPRSRKWYKHADGEYLGEDRLIHN